MANERLEIEVVSSSEAAAKALGKLASALTKINKVATANSGLPTLATQISNFAQSIENALPNIERLAEAMAKMPNVKLDSRTASAISQIGQAASDASEEIVEVGKALEETNEQGGTTEGVPQKLDEVRKKSNGAKEALQKLKDKLAQVGKSSKDTKGILGDLIGTIKRIVLYRALRSALSELIMGMKEGIENIYQYSRALGGLDSSNASGTLDGYASSLLKIKNSLAAAVIPLLNTLLPLFQSLASVIIKVVNAINQFFAALGGKTTYTRATDYMTTYGEAVSSATSSAKELKKTILGIDEINPLNDNSSGGGGGGGSSTPDYSSMFEEAAIDSKIAKIAETVKKYVEPLIDFIKENFDEILITVLAIKTALLAWKIGKKVVSAITSLLEFGKTYPTLAKALKITAGIALVITGVTLSFQAGEAIGSGTAGLMDYIKGALGVLATGVGGALITSAIGIGAAAGFAIGIPVALIATIVGVAIGSAKKAQQEMEEAFNSSGFGQKLVISTEATAKIEAKNVELEAEISSITGTVSDATMANFSLAQELINEIFSLDEEDNKTAAQIQLIQDKITTLNSLGLEGVELHFDEATQSVVETREAVQQVMDALLKQYQVEALRESYIAAYKTQYDAQVNLNDAVDDANEKLDYYKEAVANLTTSQDEQAIANQNLQGFIHDVAEEYGASDNVILDVITRNDKLNDKYMELAGALTEANNKVDANEYAVGKAKDAMDDANKALEGARDEYDKATEAVKKYSDGLEDIVTGSADASEATTQIGENISEGVAQGITSGTSTRAVSSAVNTVFGEDGRLVGYIKKDLGIHSPSTVAKKLGGYVDEGFANGITDGTKTVTSAVTTMLNAVKNTFNYYNFGSSIGNMFNKVLDKLDTFTYRFRSAVNSMLYNWKSAMNSVTINSSTGKLSYSSMSSISIPRFAQGGFVESGQLFIANESGAEMVGQMGNRTAVANNDQIVAGIASGVASANNEQNMLLREQNSLLRQLLSKDSTVQAIISTSAITEGLNRQNRRTGKTIVPVGAY